MPPRTAVLHPDVVGQGGQHAGLRALRYHELALASSYVLLTLLWEAMPAILRCLVGHEPEADASARWHYDVAHRVYYCVRAVVLIALAAVYFVVYSRPYAMLIQSIASDPYRYLSFLRPPLSLTTDREVFKRLKAAYVAAACACKTLLSLAHIRPVEYIQVQAMAWASEDRGPCPDVAGCMREAPIFYGLLLILSMSCHSFQGTALLWLVDPKTNPREVMGKAAANGWSRLQQPVEAPLWAVIAGACAIPCLAYATSGIFATAPRLVDVYRFIAGRLTAANLRELYRSLAAYVQRVRTDKEEQRLAIIIMMCFASAACFRPGVFVCCMLCTLEVHFRLLYLPVHRVLTERLVLQQGGACARVELNFDAWQRVLEKTQKGGRLEQDCPLCLSDLSDPSGTETVPALGGYSFWVREAGRCAEHQWMEDKESLALLSCGHALHGRCLLARERNYLNAGTDYFDPPPCLMCLAVYRAVRLQLQALPEVEPEGAGQADAGGNENESAGAAANVPALPRGRARAPAPARGRRRGGARAGSRGR